MPASHRHDSRKEREFLLLEKTVYTSKNKLRHIVYPIHQADFVEKLIGYF